MKDFFGQPIEVGDLVYCSKQNSTGDIRTIKKFNSNGTQALCTRDSYFYHYVPIPTGLKYQPEKRPKQDSKWFQLNRLIKAPDGYEK